MIALVDLALFCVRMFTGQQQVAVMMLFQTQHAVYKRLCSQLLKALCFEDKECSLHSHMRGFCVLFAWFLPRGNKHLFILSLVLFFPPRFVSFSVA